MDEYLRGSVRRTYQLPGKRLLLLEDDYAGGVDSGDVVEVRLPDLRVVRVVVESVAWGSAMSATNPPITLIVRWGDQPDPEPGSLVQGIAPGSSGQNPLAG